MMRRRSLLTGLGLVALAPALSACASGPAYDKALASLPKLAPGNGRIFFYRPSAFGMAYQPDVWLDGAVVGTAVPQGFFYADRPAGDHKAEIKSEVTRTLSFTLPEGQERFVRVDISPGFFVPHASPELVDANEARSEISECNLATKG